MTRRTAAERHADSAPPTASRDSRDDMLDAITAFHHPTRRWLWEVLVMEGPASVGSLAGRTGLAVGSVSHHLKALHRHGFVEPAPDLARDTRESWWRPVLRPLSWSAEDFAARPASRRVVDAAQAENFRHQARAIRDWLSHAGEYDEAWRRAASSFDSVVPATVAQLTDLEARVNGAIRDWSRACQADVEEHPEAEREPIRVIARAFPTGPVRP